MSLFKMENSDNKKTSKSTTFRTGLTAETEKRLLGSLVPPKKTSFTFLFRKTASNFTN